MLTKSGRRDPRALDYGSYWLSDPSTSLIVCDENGISLEEVEVFLGRGG